MITAVRKSVIAKVLSPESAIKALDYLFALEIQQIPFTTTLYRNIFDWSVRLNHSQAYDAVYLALAEQLQAEFWSADKRLVNRAKQLELAWVKPIS